MHVSIILLLIILHLIMCCQYCIKVAGSLVSMLFNPHWLFDEWQVKCGCNRHPLNILITRLMESRIVIVLSRSLVRLFFCLFFIFPTKQLPCDFIKIHRFTKIVKRRIWIPIGKFLGRVLIISIWFSLLEGVTKCWHIGCLIRFYQRILIHSTSCLT